MITSKGRKGIKSYKYLIITSILYIFFLILAINFRLFIVNKYANFVFYKININRDELNIYLFLYFIIGVISAFFPLLMKRFHEKEFKNNKLMKNAHIIFIYIFLIITFYILITTPFSNFF